MHLDTVFTQIDVNKYTVHPAILGPLTVYEITPGQDDPADLHIKRVDSDLKHILERYTHVDNVELIFCGGDDLIAAAREQWNDGSNTLCIAPGKIVVYQRNDVTNAILRDNGLTPGVADFKHWAAEFQREMAAGLAGEKSSLRMIPTFLSAQALPHSGEP